MHRKSLEEIAIGTVFMGSALTACASLFVVPIAGLVGGAYLGYCRGKGIPLDHEFALKYGPTIAGSVGGFCTTIAIAPTASNYRNSLEVAEGFATCSGLGAGLGALSTLAGYVVGHTVGSGGF